MKHLVIVGAGQFGRELYWHVQLSRGYQEEFDIKGYIDDMMAENPHDEAYKKVPLPLLGSIRGYQIKEDDVFICAIGTPDARAAVLPQLEERGAEFINIIHNTAIIQGQVKLGHGIFIGPFAALGDSAEIGNHVMLNTHSAIGHDAIIGDYTCIMSYVDITGGCIISSKAFLGSGCRLVPKTKVEEGAYIGIGSVVLKRVKRGEKVFGNPAKVYDI